MNTHIKNFHNIHTRIYVDRYHYSGIIFDLSHWGVIYLLKVYLGHTWPDPTEEHLRCGNIINNYIGILVHTYVCMKNAWKAILMSFNSDHWNIHESADSRLTQVAHEKHFFRPDPDYAFYLHSAQTCIFLANSVFRNRMGNVGKQQFVQTKYLRTRLAGIEHAMLRILRNLVCFSMIMTRKPFADRKKVWLHFPHNNQIIFYRFN